MKEFRFRINISFEEMERYYRGQASIAIVRTYSGSVLQLPAMRLRPFLTSEGVRGEFLLRCDDDYRFVSLQRSKYP